MPFDWTSRPDAGGTPRYLWLTWIDPWPEHDGQRMYSGRLIEAVAAAGARIEVLCFESETGPRPVAQTDGSANAIAWRTVPYRRRPAWSSFLSPLPNMAYRCATAEMDRGLREMLARGEWNAIVFDGLSAGWALGRVGHATGAGGRRPFLAHISHNHEETTRAAIARDYDGNPLKRLALARDAHKARRLERRMVGACDLVSAITPEDGTLFRRNAPDKPVIALPPGYAGHRVPARTITPDMPRVAVVVGSFEWVAKRMNLEAFLEAADPVFAAAGVRLRVVGKGPPDFIERMRRRTGATEFLGAVPEIEPHLSDARIAIVPERTGGGFKLKILDYVFHRLPVMAMANSLAGVPLRDPETARTFDDFASLAHGVVDAIDDIPALNRLQNAAYDTCRDRFDWPRRGEIFVSETTPA